jgi:thiol:disulfide interchange protein
LPGFVGSGAAAEASEQEGPLGAFLKGALTTVLATPCTGPFMGTALTWAAKQPPPVIYATFTALGLGMGLPYLAIGMFPRLLKFLPKPGMWMETFKQVMGFVLLGTVVFIFTFLEKDYLVAASGLLVGLGVACWWIGRSPVYADLQRKAFDWSVAVAIGGVIGWVSFAMLGPSDALLPWKPFSRPELERQLASGQTVLVDFTADWCMTCKVNEATALNTKKTLALVESQQLVVVKADKTHEGETSDAIDQLLADLGHKSGAIPFLVIFPGNGTRPIAFSGPVTQGMVLDAIRRAGPSRPQGLAVDPPSRRDS